MKNYPNQASEFSRVRAVLKLVQELNAKGVDVNDDGELGLACAVQRIYAFSGIDANRASQADWKQRIDEELEKPRGSQGMRTFARELRRTLRDMGWLDGNGVVTDDGDELLTSDPGSVDEQALLVEGLLRIQVEDKETGKWHHPVVTLLRLLSLNPSHRRDGLELALEPQDDSPSEFKRVANLYHMDRTTRSASTGVSPSQRDNAVKIFPTLAKTAGLVVEDGSGTWSLSHDGWSVLGGRPDGASPDSTADASAAGRVIRRHRGRRTTVGQLVTAETAGAVQPGRPPRHLTAEEQARAGERLQERTVSHQQLVSRIAMWIGNDRGALFEDSCAYDLFFVPTDGSSGAVLWEMKSVTHVTDAYARVRDAAGQLHYYHYFHVLAAADSRVVHKVVAVDAELPLELVEYLSWIKIGAVCSTLDGEPRGLNPEGEAVLAMIRAL